LTKSKEQILLGKIASANEQKNEEDLKWSIAR